MRWQSIVRWADVTLDPFSFPEGCSAVGVERFNRSEAAPGSEAGFHLYVVVEWMAGVIQLFEPFYP